MPTKKHIVFIIDKSGSMWSLREGTIAGFNTMIEKQRSEEGEALVSTYVFNEQMTSIHRQCPIREVAPMTPAGYTPQGCTALYDAVGSTLREILRGALTLSPKDTLVFVLTDGYENSSVEYDETSVKRAVEEFQCAGGKLIFLGANIDAAVQAEELGVERGHVVDYLPDEEGVKLNYEVIGEVTRNFRHDMGVCMESLDPIRHDYTKRKFS